MTERKKLELVEIHKREWTGNAEPCDPIFTLDCEPEVSGAEKITSGFIAINTTKRDLLDAFHEVYLQGQRDKENNVLHAPNLFNILGLKE